MIESYLFIALLLVPAFLGAMVSLIPSDKNIIKIGSMALCSISCIVGISAFFITGELSSRSFTLEYGPLIGEYSILFDEVSSLIITVSSAVYLMIILHMSRSDANRKMFGLACILFCACTLSMCADSVILLLLSWEMVTLTTFLMTKGCDETFRWRYFTITHFGGLIIMSVFAALWYISGTGTLSEMDGICSAIGSITASVLILLLFVGFGTKLGMLPFHAWMPDLYNSSPIHSVAFLSTVCSNVAILLLLKSSFVWIGIPDNVVLPFVILALASFGAIWGAMESLIQTEPRRILAYSSMENMSMVLICLAMGMLFKMGTFDESLMIIILAAAVLHTLNHSLFKSLMLLNVGTIEKCTGEHSIGRMGGLAMTMPLLAIFAFIGTLAMAAIPPMNGFVSEWLMIKTVVTAGTGESVLNIVLPLVVAVLGICGTMAAVSYARLYGFVFLGRPRSESMTVPKKMDKTTTVPLTLLAGACMVFGILSMPIIISITNSICDILLVDHISDSVLTDAMNPLLIAVILAAICIIVYGLFRLTNKKKRLTKTWDCGTELNSNMQYSSEGFTQPLVNVFHPFYGDETEVNDVNGGTDTFKIRYLEPFNKYILMPIGRSVNWISLNVGKIQNGNIQSYLAYLLITLIIILLGVRFV